MEDGFFRFYNRLLAAHISYLAVTAFWPLIHIDSFMYLTGMKTDVWLVKTVSLLLIAVAVSLSVYAYYRLNVVAAATLGITQTAALAIIDIRYSLSGTISSIYLIDGAIEITLLVLWSIVL
jgi:hypothetical protein